MQTAKEKRREMIIDLSVCLGLPAFVTIICEFHLVDPITFE